MSGTPMKDSPTEIADVMNLILPYPNSYLPEKHSVLPFDERGNRNKNICCKAFAEEYLI